MKKDCEDENNDVEIHHEQPQQETSTTTTIAIPTIYSLDEYNVHLEPCIRKHLEDQYNNDTNNYNHLQNIINAMKRPPASTVCRVNLIKATPVDVQNELRNLLLSDNNNLYKIQEHPIFSKDVITILPSSTKTKTKAAKSLSSCKVPVIENTSSSSSSSSSTTTRP